MGTEKPHRSILLSPDKISGLRGLARLKDGPEEREVPRRLMEGILADADSALEEEPITVFTPLPGRSPEDLRQGNPEYIVVNAAGQRVLRFALACALGEERRYADAALAQVECLFDPSAWPEWQDLYHRRSLNLDADLRTGQLARDLGMAYGWLYPHLTSGERRRVVEGIDRRAVQPYLRALAARPPWIERLSNWTTCIVGGLGICGMALGPDHSESAELVEISLPVMQRYLGLYGPQGEFNENPSYANSSFLPVLYFSALRDYRGETGPAPQIAALGPHCYWCIYATAPPGHAVSFGDGGPDYPAVTSFFPAVAAALRDPVLQWFYLAYGDPPPFPVWELLWFDPTLKPRAPTEDNLPLGRGFPAHSGLVSSRASWDPRSTPCVVFGKAGHGGMIHSHPDAGQVEIHAHARRLIVDLGRVSYPPGDDRRPYYHFGSDGHNLITIGGRPPFWEAEPLRRSYLSDHVFASGLGGWWRVDLTELHEGVERVQRTVVHLLPGIVAVLDEADLQRKEKVRLRWHPIVAPRIDAGGRFGFAHKGAGLDAIIASSCRRDLELSCGRHQYLPPRDRDRLGNPLPQRREPFIDALAEGRAVWFLSLFSVGTEAETGASWQLAAGEAEIPSWSIAAASGPVAVVLASDYLKLSGLAGEWQVRRSGA